MKQIEADFLYYWGGNGIFIKQDDATNSFVPVKLCPYCNKPEHGTAACTCMPGGYGRRKEDRKE